MKKFGIMAAMAVLMGLGCATPTTVPAAEVREPTPCETAKTLVSQQEKISQGEAPTLKLTLDFCYLVDDGDGDFAIGLSRGRITDDDGQVSESAYVVAFRKAEEGWVIAGAKSIYAEAPIPSASKPKSDVSKQPTQAPNHKTRSIETTKNGL